MDSKYCLTPKMGRLLKKIEARQYKLLEKFNQSRDLILENPLIGKRLEGGLKKYRSLDFTMNGVALRICYIFNPDDDRCIITFVWFGTRENFYKEVARYVN